jgi:hypothetical protein
VVSDVGRPHRRRRPAAGWRRSASRAAGSPTPSRTRTAGISSMTTPTGHEEAMVPSSAAQAVVTRAGATCRGWTPHASLPPARARLSGGWPEEERRLRSGFSADRTATGALAGSFPGRQAFVLGATSLHGPCWRSWAVPAGPRWWADQSHVLTAVIISHRQAARQGHTSCSHEDTGPAPVPGTPGRVLRRSRPCRLHRHSRAARPLPVRQAGPCSARDDAAAGAWIPRRARSEDLQS